MIRRITVAALLVASLVNATVINPEAGLLAHHAWKSHGPESGAIHWGPFLASDGEFSPLPNIMIAGRGELLINAKKGVLFFGTPVGQYDPGMQDVSTVGVPVLDLFGDNIVATPESKVDVYSDGTDTWIDFSEYALLHGGNERIHVQVVTDKMACTKMDENGAVVDCLDRRAKGKDAFRVNWKIVKAHAEDVLHLSEGYYPRMLFWDGSSEESYTVKFNDLLSGALEAEGVTLFENGAPNPELYFLTDGGWEELEYSSNGEYGRFAPGDKIRGVCGDKSQIYGCGNGMQWLSRDESQWRWGEFTSVTLKYRVNPGVGGASGNQWGVWFFNDEGVNAEVFGLAQIPFSTSTDVQVATFSMEDYVAYPEKIGVTEVGDLSLKYLKVMGRRISGASSLDLYSVVLNRQQPPSLRFFGIPKKVIDPPPPPPPPGTVTLKATLLGTNLAGLEVKASSGAEMQKVPVALGKATITNLASKTWIVQPQVASGTARTFVPASRTWNPGDATELMFSVYDGSLQWTNEARDAISTTEGVPQSVSINTWVKDPTNAAAKISCQVSDLSPAYGLPWTYDRTLSNLTLGSATSDATGTTTLRLICTGPSGASIERVLSYEVKPVNDAPTIRASTWSVQSGKTLDVNLDELTGGKPKWVSDPDDSYLNLVWSASWLGGAAPQGASIAIQNRHLIVGAPESFQGDIIVHLVATDPQEGTGTRDVVVRVVSPDWQGFGCTGIQDDNGYLVFTYQSRYSSEPLVLQKDVVEFRRSSGWLSFPAKTTIVQPPAYVDGVWTDGQYKVVVSPTATSGGVALKTVFAGAKSLQARLPVAAQGRTATLTATIDPVDLSMPTAEVVLSHSYDEIADKLHQHPTLSVSWKVDEGVVVQSVERLGVDGTVLASYPVASNATLHSIANAEDNATHRIRVVAKDAKGNVGGGSATHFIPSGLYPATIVLNDASLREVTGRLVVDAGRPGTVGKELSKGVDGVHTLDMLTLGVHYATIDDPKWAGDGVELAFDVTRTNTPVPWKLVPRSFLVAGTDYVEQDEATGDLRASFEVRSPFVDERPVEIVWSQYGATKSLSGSVTLDANKGVFSKNGSRWTIAWKRDQLPSEIWSNSVFTAPGVRRMKSLSVSTSLQTGADAVVFRKDVLSHVFANEADRMWSFQAPTPFTANNIPTRQITGDGLVEWAYSVVPTHGALWKKKVCLVEADDGRVCQNLIAAPTAARLAFLPDISAAHPRGSERALEGVPSKIGMVRAPAGSGKATGQWRVWIPTAGEYTLHLKYESPVATIDPIEASLDSGETWATTHLDFSGWSNTMTSTLAAGWHLVTIRLPEGETLSGVALVPTGGSIPTGKLPLASDAFDLSVGAQLVLDRDYEETDSLVDGVGNSSVLLDAFHVAPEGLFADLTVELDSAKNELVLRTSSSKFDPSVGTFLLKVSNVDGASISGTEIVPSVRANGSGMEMRFARDLLPAAVRDSVIARPSKWTFVLYNTTSYTTVSYKASCILGLCPPKKVEQVHDKTARLYMHSSGHYAWKAPFDTRALPPLSVNLVHAGVDSIALEVTGYDKTSNLRGSAPGILHAKWSPGSQCASTTSRDIPVRHVFVAGESDGAVAFSPRSFNATRIEAGLPVALDKQPIDLSTPALGVQQWHDLADGGGFYPDAKIQSTAQAASRPWVSFSIRNPSAYARAVRLAFVPGSYSGIERQKFEYRLQPAEVSQERSWNLGTGYRPVGASGASWMFASSASVILEPGRNELQVRMFDPGTHFVGFALAPVPDEGVATLPTSDATTLPVIGDEGVFVVNIGAGSLSPSTGHTFTFQAEDRWGNTSPVATYNATTSSPAEKLPTVRISVPEIDAQGWIIGSSLSAQYKSFGAGVLPEGVLLKARLRLRDGTTGEFIGQAVDVTTTPGTESGTWSSSAVSVPEYPLLDADYAEGDRVVLEAWLATANSQGPHTTVEFGARLAAGQDSKQNGVVGAKIGGVTFSPRLVWSYGAGNSSYMADLSIPQFTIHEGDTAVDRLYLRGARVDLDANRTMIRDVFGGAFQAVRCKVAGTVESECSEIPKMPTSLGRWSAWMLTDSMKVEGVSTTKSISTKHYEVIDDMGRPVKAGNTVVLGDGGVQGRLNLDHDRFWFKNIVHSTDEEAFGVEACKTIVDVQSGQLKIEARGCSETVGPFLTFPWHLQTDGAWSVIGNAFDSIAAPYMMTWSGASVFQSKWNSGRPEYAGTIGIPAAVTITQSALRGVFGASMWGYDVKSYTFGPSGVTNLVFDLLAPDGKVTPYQYGAPQALADFTGCSITSSSAVMKGRPVLVPATAGGACVSTETRSLRLGQKLILDGATKWTFKREDGLGWTLRPTGTLALKRAQISGWKYELIGTTDQDDDSLSYGVTSMLIGPDRYYEAVSTQTKVEIETSTYGTSSAKVKATLSLAPDDQQLLQVVTAPSIELEEFFTDDDGESKDVSMSEVDLTLDGEFGLNDVNAFATAPAQSEVWVAGAPWVKLYPSKTYQILANRGRMLVRLNRPQADLKVPLDNSSASQNGEKTTEVQSAVLTTSRLPVAVGVELPVPSTLQPYVLGDLGSLELSSLSLDASTTIATTGEPSAKLALTGATTIKLGRLFEPLGMNGWKLPVRSVTMGLTTSSETALSGDLSFETSPLPLALRAELTRGQIASLVGKKDVLGNSSDVLLRLTTAGLPITASYKDDELHFLLKDWELELTKDFPIEAMQNSAFHLDEVSATVSEDGFELNSFSGSGEITTPELKIAPYVSLKGATDADVVKVSLEKSGNTSKFTITASKIKIGDKTYDIGCSGEAQSSLTLGLDGDIEGNVCFLLKEDVVLYPLRDKDDQGNTLEKSVWVTAENKGVKTKVLMSVSGGVFSLEVADATVKTKAMNPFFKEGMEMMGGLKLVASSDGLVVEKANLGSALTLSENYGGFKFGVSRYDFSYSRPDDQMKLTLTPYVGFKNADADAGCGGGVEGSVTFSAKPKIDTKTLSIDWNMTNGTFGCTIEQLKFKAEGISLTGKDDDFVVKAEKFSVLVDEGLWGTFFQGNDATATDVGAKTDFVKSKGFIIPDMKYVSSSSSFSMGKIIPIGFSMQKPVRIEIPGVGVVVSAVMDYSPLITDDTPGLLFKDVGVKFPEAVGGYELNTSFGVLFNGRPGYVHPKGPARIPFALPKIPLSSFAFDEAKLVLRYEEQDKKWILEGRAKMTLSGAIEKMDAFLQLEKPGRCNVGICQAALKVRLAKGSRIPVGTTGLFITGLKGGFYDGPYQPPCAKACTGVDMPTGMKVDLYAYIEASNPALASGGAGMWMHLSELEFGLNGDMRLMSGVASAKACAALFGGGKRFHGDFYVFLDAKLLADGRFVVDIWSDRRGKNLAAEASARVGLGRGAIIRSRWFKFPRGTRWFGPYVTRFGRFKSGSNGFTTGVRALGSTWGVGYVDGGFRLGNVGKYKLASPTQSALAAEELLAYVNGDNYKIYPLSLDLKGGEVITVNLGSADGTDWNGARIELLEPNTSVVVDEASGEQTTVTSSTYTVNNALEKAGNVVHEDSANIHSLIWRNENIGSGGTSNSYVIGIPVRAKPAEGQTIGPEIGTSYDDLQVLVGLVPPTVNLTAVECSDNSGAICISGKVQQFRTSTYTLSTNYSQGDQAKYRVTNKMVLAQRHRLQLYAAEVPPGKRIGKDSMAFVQIPLDEIEGLASSQNAYSVADDATCAASSTTDPTTLVLTNCRWKPKSWPSGKYRVAAGVEVENQLDALNEPEKADVVFLDQTRVVLAKAAGADPAVFQIDNPDPVLSVRGLAVHGSALDSVTTGKRDERRLVSARWNAQEHPEIIGYQITWTDNAGKLHLFEAGSSGEWDFEVPNPSQYMSKGTSDPVDDARDEARVMWGSELDWMYELPKSLTVAPRLRTWNSAVDSFETRVATDKAATWTGTITLGASAGSVGNEVTPRAVPLKKLRLDSILTLLDTMDVTLPVTRSPTLANGEAVDYARVDFRWVDGKGNPIVDTNELKRVPVVSSDFEGWRIQDLTRGSLELTLSATSMAELCTSPANVHDTAADGSDSLLTSNLCELNDTITYPTRMGNHWLEVRVWNLGRLEAGKAKTTIIPIRVLPPAAKIDRVEPDYLVADVKTNVRVIASQLRLHGTQKPVLRILDASKNAINGFVSVGDASPTSYVEVDPDSIVDGRLRQTFTVKLPAGLTGNTVHLALANPWPAELGTQASDESVETSETIAFVKRLQDVACLGANTSVSAAGYEQAMDFVGIYPYIPRDADTMQALFSEVWAPEGLKWQLTAAQGQGTPVTIPVLETDQGGFRFVLPAGFDRDKPVQYSFKALDGAYGACATAEFTDDTKAPMPALTAPRLRVAPPFITTGTGLLENDAASAVFTFPRLRNAERVEWVLGTPRDGQAWDWRSGEPVWGEVMQPDSVHVRIRHRDIGVLQEHGYLVLTSPRILTLEADGRVLKSIDKVDAMSRIVPKVFPAPTKGLDGTSRMELQCRFGGDAWTTCPEKGWQHGTSLSGKVEIRVVWTIHGRGPDRIVDEPARTWTIAVRDPSESGIVKVPLMIEGRRLSHLLDTASSVVTALRRSGTDLPSWPATPPVVRTTDGDVLPQQTEQYDPTNRKWLVWVALPNLAAGHDLPLELWVGDNAVPESPWSGIDARTTQRLANSGTTSGHLAAVALDNGAVLDWPLASSNTGWSVSFWSSWNGAPRTIWSSAGLSLGVDDSGCFWGKLDGTIVRSKPLVVDRIGPHLFAATWNKGAFELWCNGILVGSARADIQADGPFAIGTVHLDAATSLDEIRWEGWRSPGTWPVRYAAEHPRGDLWAPVVVSAKSDVVASYTSSQYDTTGIHADQVLWQDRDQHVTAWPAFLQGGTLLRGRGAEAGSRSIVAGRVTLSGYAQVCGVGDGLWKPASPWANQGTLFATDVSAPLWCRELPPGEHPLPGSDDTLHHRGLRSWVVVPAAGRDTRSTSAAVGDVLTGGAKVKDLPSANLVKVVTNSDGSTPALPGDLLVVCPKDMTLPAGADVVDSILVTLPNGTTEVRLLVRWPDNIGIPPGADAYRLDPVIVEPTLGSDATRIAVRNPITFLDGSKTSDWPWLPAVVPAVSNARTVSMSWDEPVQLWLAVPPSVPASAMSGWTPTERVVRVVAQDGKTEEYWKVWTRSQGAGPMTIDMGKWFPSGDPARFILIGEGRVKVAPAWSLGRMNLRGVGGPASVTGGLHRMTNLDMKYAAALALKSDRHVLRIAGVTGYGQRMTGLVQGLGGDRLVARTGNDGTTEHLIVTSSATLYDLRADLLNTDSVRVDVVALRAKGTARVTVMQNGSTTFPGGVDAVLFRDRDGDYRYTEGVDERLGARSIGAIPSGGRQVVEFPLAEHDVRYPEELYLAWIDAPSVPETVVGDHLAVAGNPCLERKEMSWNRSVRLDNGASVLLAHVRDTDGDGRIRPNDIEDTLWMRLGQVCYVPGSEGASSWCHANTGVGSEKDLSVRDIDGDGRAEILAGTQVYDGSGAVVLDLNTVAAGTNRYDFDEDGALDQIAINGSCKSLGLADGQLAWSAGCTDVGAWAGLGAIPRHSEGCVDVSVSGLEVRTSQLLVRVANAGNVRLDAELPVVVRAEDGSELVRSATSKVLEPGAWEDIWLPRPSSTSYRVEVEGNALTNRGLLDFDPKNNARSWSQNVEVIE